MSLSPLGSLSLPSLSLPALPSLPPLSSGTLVRVPHRLHLALMRRVGPLPLPLLRSSLEPWLNRTLAEPLSEGEFDVLEGRRVALEIEDLAIAVTMTLEDGRLRATDLPWEVSIKGGWREFVCLAQREEDPDSLFFQRRLCLEGDTELGLTVKNLLDGQEMALLHPYLAEALGTLQRWLSR
ncbi:SCP2 sterol-binding domain-containing protein [Halomonas denitrificans]|uniref:ubiquinone anaerobic biosynthesis accessory factor UbiT n=1 Tax=Halomonas denitrificans TaxID=370769 RepID=UPI001CD5E33A|nr:SCP2 sterol-binding domain-containing protein [Halomonas denitrificans]MCA0974378.1 SCP2 sterol-binding domain-containing protein [Halomonas denitrificans]